MRKILLTAGKVAVAGGLLATPIGVAAVAHAGPYSRPAATVSVSHPSAGGSVTVGGTGFQPDSRVTVTIYSTPVRLGTMTADANGDVAASVTIPSSFAPGTHHTIRLTGVGTDGATRTQSIGFTLAAAAGSASDESSSLPFTGIDALALGTTGAGLVGLGGFLVYTSRRKKLADQE